MSECREVLVFWKVTLLRWRSVFGLACEEALPLRRLIRRRVVTQQRQEPFLSPDINHALSIVLDVRDKCKSYAGERFFMLGG